MTKDYDKELLFAHLHEEFFSRNFINMTDMSNYINYHIVL